MAMTDGLGDKEQCPLVGEKQEGGDWMETVKGKVGDCGHFPVWKEAWAHGTGRRFKGPCAPDSKPQACSCYRKA